MNQTPTKEENFPFHVCCSKKLGIITNGHRYKLRVIMITTDKDGLPLDQPILQMEGSLPVSVENIKTVYNTTIDLYANHLSGKCK